MKKLIAGVFVLLAVAAKAQAPNYDDLRILFADGNYEKLVAKAEGYSNKEDNKKDPLPHFWLGRGLYAISVTNSTDEKFKNAYKESVTSIGKAIKLDSDGSLQKEYEEFFTEYRTSLVERIRNDVEDPKTKASAWVVKYYKIDPNSPGAKYLEGVFKFRAADKTGAGTAWKDADAKVAKLSGVENWNPADKELLKIGVIQTAKTYMVMKQTDKAKNVLGKVKQWYEEDKEFMDEYDEIVN